MNLWWAWICSLRRTSPETLEAPPKEGSVILTSFQTGPTSRKGGAGPETQDLGKGWRESLGMGMWLQLLLLVPLPPLIETPTTFTSLFSPPPFHYLVLKMLEECSLLQGISM